MFYDEFPLSGSAPGFGGGFFNGAQEFAFNKNALEQGLPVTRPTESRTEFNVAIENMGLLPTPDGTCARDNALRRAASLLGRGDPGAATRPQPVRQQSRRLGVHAGRAGLRWLSGLPPAGDNRIAVFDWTGLRT